jgi:hypothetical protein
MLSVGSGADHTTAGRLSRTRRIAAAHMSAIALLCVLLYYPALNRPLTSWDDQRWLADTQVRNSLATIFDFRLRTNNPFPSTYYIPLQSALYYGLTFLFGTSPPAFHLVGLAIHVAVCLLLYLLVVNLGARREAALLAAMFVAAHLGNVQAVTWVSASFSHPLVTVFILLTVLLFRRYLEFGTLESYLLALLTFTIALLIRESAIIVPLLLLAMQRFCPVQVGRDPPPTFSFAPAALRCVPFALACIPIALIAAYKYQNGHVHQYWGGVNFGVHALLRLLDFASLTLFPARASAAVKLVLCALVLLASFGLVFFFQRAPAALFALIWLYLGLAPYAVSNFSPALEVTRYLYVGLLGVALLFSNLVSAAERRLARQRHLVWGAAGLVVLGHMVATFRVVH